MKIVLDAYDWRAHIGLTETQEGAKMRVQLYVDCKCRKTMANARMETKKTGSHKVQYTWHA